MTLGKWPDLRLRTKGLILIGAPAAATVLIACAFYVLAARAESAEQALLRSLESNAEIRLLRTNDANASAQLRGYFVTRGEAFAKGAGDGLATFDNTLRRLSELTSDDPVQALHVSEIASFERMRVEQTFGAMARFHAGALPDQAMRAAVATLEANRVKTEASLKSMERQQARVTEVRSRAVARLHLEMSSASALCVVFGLTAGIGMSLLFASGITKRVAKLRDSVARLAEGGELETEARGGDEIQALNEGIAHTVQLLRQRSGALENALHGIAQLDQTGSYLSFNKAYAELAWFSEKNRPANFSNTVLKDDWGKVEEAVQRMRATGHSEIEVRICNTNTGSTIDVAMTFLPASGDKSGSYYVFLRDISQRKETEAALVRAKEEALASSRAKNDFLAKISHDIRTPLNAILGAANLLAETSLSPEQKEYFSLYQRNSGRLVSLINDFLDFSKIEAGALKLEKIPFRIGATVEDAVATFRETAHRKGIGLEVEIERDLPEWEMGDPLRLQQILVNLLSNAIKFTEVGKVTLRVLWVVSPAGDRIGFEVSDTGPGIDDADQQRVFAAFTQVPKTQTGGAIGCGLGLTICRELVERMGGEIGLTSELGRGSKFFFTIPLEVAQVVDSVQETASPKVSAGPVRGTKLRILIAEDGADNRLLLTHYLRPEPVEPRFAENGKEALDAVTAGEQFDLILMDLDMPVLNGYQATQQILEWQKANGEVPTPIVALSAHAMREAQHASLVAGCVAHVPKPVDKATLLKAIYRHSRTKAARQQESTEIAEGLAALVPKYLASKPRQIDEARASLAAKDFDPIKRFGHNLKGTGRGYGFPPIEQMGQAIEKAAASHDEGIIAEQLESLYRFVAKAQEGSRVEAG